MPCDCFASYCLLIFDFAKLSPVKINRSPLSKNEMTFHICSTVALCLHFMRTSEINFPSSTKKRTDILKFYLFNQKTHLSKPNQAI